MLPYVFAFLASAAIVVAAGTALTRAADAIAEATGLGRAWIGAVLLAGATSLPEIVTDVSAVRMHAPNLAAGDLFGSSLANMLILAIIDQLSRRGSVLRAAAIETALVACLAIILNTLGALFVLTQWRTTLLGVSPESVLLLLVYLGGTRAVYRNGVRHAQARASAATPQKRAAAAYSPRRTAAVFVGAAAGILVASPGLAWSAKHIAQVSGLGNRSAASETPS